MDKSLLVSNPFALMMNPEDVILAMHHSDRLSRLHRRICKPLDKPLLPKAGPEVDAFDHEVDDAVEVDDGAGVPDET